MAWKRTLAISPDQQASLRSVAWCETPHAFAVHQSRRRRVRHHMDRMTMLSVSPQWGVHDHTVVYLACRTEVLPCNMVGGATILAIARVIDHQHDRRGCCMRLVGSAFSDARRLALIASASHDALDRKNCNRCISAVSDCSSGLAPVSVLASSTAYAVATSAQIGTKTLSLHGHFEQRMRSCHVRI